MQLYRGKRPEFVAVYGRRRVGKTYLIKELFKDELKDEEKVLVDVKSLYRMDELKASGMRFWRL